MPTTLRDTFTVELHPTDESRTALLRAVLAAAAERYSVVGEMEAPDGGILLLARSNDYGQLVTLAAWRDSHRGAYSYAMTVAPVRRAPVIGDAELAAPARLAPAAPTVTPPREAYRDDPPVEPPPAAPVDEEPEEVAPTVQEQRPVPVYRPVTRREEAHVAREERFHGERELEVEPESDAPSGEWAEEMRSYSGWRSRSVMVAGAVALLVLIALVALGMRQSGAESSRAADTSADSVDGVALPAIDAGGVTPARQTSLTEPPPVAALTEPPSDPAPVAAVTRPRRVAAPPRQRTRRSAPPNESAAAESRGALAPAAARAAFGGTAAAPAASERAVERGVERDRETSLTSMRRAALTGDAEAQSQLGLAYENGRGVRQDLGEAIAWFRKAGNQGHAWSQNHLGWMYARGTGVSRNDSEAARWFRLAAERGHAEGQYNLGFMHQHGRGVTRSRELALQWYRRSAAQGNAAAKRALRALGES
jgi:hypothetical protein